MSLEFFDTYTKNDPPDDVMRDIFVQTLNTLNSRLNNDKLRGITTDEQIQAGREQALAAFEKAREIHPEKSALVLPFIETPWSIDNAAGLIGKIADVLWDRVTEEETT